MKTVSCFRCITRRALCNWQATFIAALLLIPAVSPLRSQSVLEYHNNDQRQGVNIDSTLNPGNVSSSFGYLGQFATDGRVYAQPLYVAGLNIAGGSYNTLFIATENNSVYAFNADSPGSGPFWQVSLGYPYMVGQVAPSCTHLGAVEGITSTPVIDINTSTLYIVALSAQLPGTGSGSWYTAYGLDLATGNTKSSYTFSSAGPNSKSFIPTNEVQRAALAFGHGNLFVAFADFCGEDNPAEQPSYGLLYELNTSPLSSANVFDSEPNDAGGGIWMGGGGPSFDAFGNAYFSVSNCGYGSDGSCNSPSYDNSVMKIGPTWAQTWQYQAPNHLFLSQNDYDLGSSDVVLFNPPNSSTEMAATAGKQGEIYVFDRDQIGSGGSELLYQDSSQMPSIFGGITYFNGQLFVMRGGGGLNGYLQSYTVASNGLLSAATQSPNQFTPESAAVSISASDLQNSTNTGVVWAIGKAPSGFSTLYAYTASNLAQQLFSYTLGDAPQFAVPTVAGGKVFASFYNQTNGADSNWGINVFGLR